MARRGTGRTPGPTNERQTKAAGAVYYALRPQPEVQDPRELLAAAPQAARAAGCTDARNVGPYQPEAADRTHVAVPGGPPTMPPISTYPSVPPASGPHGATPWSRGVYSTPPPIDQVIHSLEHGAAVVWYAPDVSGDELAKIEDFYRDASHGLKVIVAPYDYPDQGAEGTLPGGSRMALVAWHHVETCSRLSLPAAFGFTARYGIPPFGNQRSRQGLSAACGNVACISPRAQTECVNRHRRQNNRALYGALPVRAHPQKRQGRADRA